MERCRCADRWLAVPTEILELILSGLDLADHARFACVCRAWCLAATTSSPIHKPLSLTLSSNPEKLISSYLSYFFDRYQGKGWDIRFVGAFEGWLVMLTSNRGLRHMFLLNRLAEYLIELPRMRNRFMRYGGNINKVVLSSPPSSGSRSRSSSSSSSSNDCIIVAMYDCGELEFCRPGDKSWTEVTKPPDVLYYKDILFHKDQLHAIGNIGALVVFDHDLKPKMIEGSWLEFISVQLVELRGELCVVRSPQRMIPAPRLDVHRLDPSQRAWVMVGSLGDDVLLLSRYCSLAVSTADYPAYRANCIYRIHHKPYGPLFPKGERGGASVFSLDERRFVRIEPAKRSAVFFTLFYH